MFSAFTEHVPAFDAAAAAEYGPIVTQRDHLATPIAGVDAQIAAICRAHGAVLATRNVRDFQATGVDVLDPWDCP